MCEILCTRGNRKKVAFGLDAYITARANNRDGAGYVIFQRTKEGFDLVENATFGAKPVPYYEYQEPPIDLEADEVEEVPFRTAGYNNVPKRKIGFEQPTYPYHYGGGGKTLVTPHDEVPDEMLRAQDSLKYNQVMISHFRLATSGGVIHENTHPIINGDYLVIHNGVLGYSKLPAGYSDTRLFTSLLNEASKRLKGKITPKKEQKLINAILDVAGGYWSMYVYSFKTKQLYYFKEEYASYYHDASGYLCATRSARFPVYSKEAKSGLIR